MISGLQETATTLNLPFGDRQQTCNSRRAQELGLWAASQGKGEIFRQLAFVRYFVDGANLAKLPVLLEIAQAAGLDEKEAMETLTTQSFGQAVDRDWSLSRLLGVTAVPTFIMGRDRLVGAQGYEILEEMLLANGAARLSR